MPTYEYVCRSCGHTFEIVQSMNDVSLTICPECGGELRKVFGAPAISFKGSGFYATDHGKKAKKPSEKSPEKSSEPSSSTSDKKSDASDGTKSSKKDAPKPPAAKPSSAGESGTSDP